MQACAWTQSAAIDRHLDTWTRSLAIACAYLYKFMHVYPYKFLPVEQNQWWRVDNCQNKQSNSKERVSSFPCPFVSVQALSRQLKIGKTNRQIGKNACLCFLADREIFATCRRELWKERTCICCGNATSGVACKRTEATWKTCLSNGHSHLQACKWNPASITCACAWSQACKCHLTVCFWRLPLPSALSFSTGINLYGYNFIGLQIRWWG